MAKERFKSLRATLKPNKPKWTPDHPTKKMVVLAKDGNKEKIIRFGAKGYKHNYSDKARKSFRARHGCDDAKDKLSARYWACKRLWTKSNKG